MKQWQRGGDFLEIAMNNEVHCSVIVVAVAACSRIHRDSKLIVALVDRETMTPEQNDRQDEGNNSSKQWWLCRGGSDK